MKIKYIEQVYRTGREVQEEQQISLLPRSCVNVSSTNCKAEAPNIKTVLAREAFPTHPLFSCSVDRPNTNKPIIPVDLIKTSAIKNPVGKTLASRKKSADSHLLTWCKNIQTGTFLLQCLVTSTPFFQ